MKSFNQLSVCLFVSQLIIATAFADGLIPNNLPTSVPTSIPTSLSQPANSGIVDSNVGGLKDAVKAGVQKAKVNLNTASVADIAKLPGIGPTKADAIVAGRPYNTPADVMKVKGIKQGVFNKIKNFITVK